MENQKHTAHPLSSTSNGANQPPDDPLFEEARHREDYGAGAGHGSPPDLAPTVSAEAQLPVPQTSSTHTSSTLAPSTQSPSTLAPSTLAPTTQASDTQTPSTQTLTCTDAEDFVPAERERQRADGWTPQRQRDFIAMLADTGCVREAAKLVGMSESGAYQLRRSPDGQSFSYAWEMAMRQASRRLVDVAFERAVKGVEDPVFDRDGQCTYVRRKYNDRLLMFLLRAHNPAQYGIGDERIIDLDDRENVEDWANGYTPLTAALEILNPTLDEGFGEGSLDAENSETAE